MNIPTLTAFFNASRPASTTRINSTVCTTTTASSGVKPSSDVTISSAGRYAAYAEKATSTAENRQHGTSETAALEMYQVPMWLADYGFEVPNQLGVRGNWFAEKYPKAAAASPAVLAEYSSRLDEHLQTVLGANGIRGLDDFHNALITNERTSEQIRQQLAERIRNDPMMVDMMMELGKV